MITIALVDDHTIFRKAFAHFISNVCKVPVSIEAENGKELLSQLEKTYRKPDIILSDIQMPVMGGNELALQISKNYPSIKLIALSQSTHESVITEMFHCGAKGYLTKNIDPHVLLKAFSTVMEGHYFLFDGHNSHTFLTLKNYYYRSKNQVHLTQKQKEFLKFCAMDLPYKTIAEKMQISPRTIDIYRDQLFEKLKVSSRTGLIIYAVQNGLVETTNT
jgi:DNA-binding NarL/FixJ family response regulator